MKHLSLTITSTAVVSGLAFSFLQVESFKTMWIFFIFCFGPLLGTLFLSIITKNNMAQVALLASTVGYVSWFLIVYHKVITTPDAQSPIAFMFVGIFAVPFLLLIWIPAIILAILNRPRMIQI